MKYLLGSGFFNRPNIGADWFFKYLWWENVHKYSQPERVVIFAMGGHVLKGAPGDWITLNGNLGHMSEILNHSKPYPYCGNGVAIAMLALLSYSEECDFVYHEQDLLAFGPAVQAMYDQIGEAGLIMGRQKCQPCANSFFMVRHFFIPKFVSWYLSSEPETSPENISEHKFARWQEANPKEIVYYSFGYDRDRPFNTNDPVFYAQKLNKEELLDLKGKGLICFDNVPDGVERFSNCPSL